MKTGIKMLVYVIMIFILLLGCNDSEKDSTSINKIKSVEYEEPPELILTIGEDVIKTLQGAYSWYYSDISSGQEVVVTTDHATPNEMVNIDQGVKVDISEPVRILFAIEPDKYEIRIWNNNEVIATYNTFKDIKEKGKYIVEIISNWGKSTATYVVALDI